MQNKFKNIKLSFVIMLTTITVWFAVDCAVFGLGKMGVDVGEVAIFGAQARAVEYYVDQNHPQASDSNPGTEDLPWETLKKAGDTAVAGDTVFIKGGVYKGPLFPKNSGTSSNYISFKGVQGDNVIIEGGYEVTGWAAHADSIYSASWDSSWLSAEQPGISGSSGFVNVDYKLDADHWPKPTLNLGEMINGSWYYDNDSKKLYLWLEDSSNPNDHTILAATSWYYSANGILIHGKRYLRFDNIEIRNCYSGVYIDPEGSQDIFLNNIEAYGVHTGVRNVRGNNNIFMTQMDIHHTIGPGIQNNGSNCTIAESRIHETGMVKWQRWGNTGVILMGAYNTLRDSEIYNTGYNSTYGPGVVFETWGTYGEGGADTSHDNIVENCVIYNSPNFYGIVFYGSDNCIARKNIIYNMKGGIRIQKGGDAGEMTEEQKVTNNSKIFNNSIIECSEFGIKITDNCLNTEFYNNIFYQIGTPLNFRESVKNSIESSHNNFYSDGGFRIVYGDTTYTSLTDYSQATGKEQNSLYADPLFNNPTNSDFYLKSNSACIDAGDTLDLPYEGAAPDIGAYEYTSATPDTTPPILSNPSPSTTLPAGTTQTTISLTTNETATCKYSTTPNIPYASITNTFSTTGGTTHSQIITGLSDGNGYNYYVRCIDEANNPNTDDFNISFSIASSPSPTTYNILNFAQLIIDWLAAAVSTADLNNDGVVNTRDLGIMMSSWEE